MRGDLSPGHPFIVHSFQASSSVTALIVMKVRDLKKWYEAKKGLFGKPFYVKAVDGVDFDVGNEVFCIVGESGCGKSTLLRTLIGLERATAGNIFIRVPPSTLKYLKRVVKSKEAFDGEMVDITKLPERGLRRIRRHIQMIFQDPYSSLDPKMKIWEIVAEPLIVHKLVKNKEEALKKVIDVLEKVKLSPPEDFIERYPHQLSGGQRQRVAIARALIVDPQIILADEPVSMLDVSIRAEILSLLKELNKKYNKSLIVVTHDLSTTTYLCDRIAVMYLGKIVEEGPTKTLIREPLHPYTRALINAIPKVDPKKPEIKILIKGEIVVGAPPRGCRFMPRCPIADRMCEKEPPLEEVGNNRRVACWKAFT